MLILKLVVVLYLIDYKYVPFVITSLTVAVNSDLELKLFYIWRKIAASITYGGRISEHPIATPNTWWRLRWVWKLRLVPT